MLRLGVPSLPALFWFARLSLAGEAVPAPKVMKSMKQTVRLTFTSKTAEEIYIHNVEFWGVFASDARYLNSFWQSALKKVSKTGM
jgi:hypothetical protein